MQQPSDNQRNAGRQQKRKYDRDSAEPRQCGVMQMPFLSWRSNPSVPYGQITNNFGENERKQKRAGKSPQIEKSQAGLRAGIRLTRNGRMLDEGSAIRGRSMLGRLSETDYKTIKREQVFSL